MATKRNIIKIVAISIVLLFLISGFSVMDYEYLGPDHNLNDNLISKNIKKNLENSKPYMVNSNAPEVFLGNVNTSYFQNVYIPIYVNNENNFTNLSEVFSFDPYLLKFVGILNDVSSQYVNFTTINLSKGIVKVIGNGTFISLPTKTTLYYLEFSPVKEIQTVTTVLLDYFILNGVYYNSTSSSKITLAGGWKSYGPRNVPITLGVSWGAHMTMNGTGMTNAIAFSPYYPNIIYEGSGSIANAGFGGIMKSTDGGLTWEQVNLGINYTMVQSIWVNPLNPNIVVAIANEWGFTGGIFKTINGGASWQETFSGSGGILQFVPDVGLYAIMNHCVIFSPNLGNTWKMISSTSNNIVSGIILNNGSKIELAENIPDTNQMIIYISLNGGSTYVSCQYLEASNLVNIIADPSNKSIQWMTHWEGYQNDSLYKSTDGGFTWHSVNYSSIGISSFAEGSCPAVISYDPSNASIMYTGGDAWVAKSVNGGNTFTELLNVVIAAYVIAIDPLNDSNVYIGGEQGIVVTRDGGNTWQSINNRSSSITQGIVINGNNSVISLGNFNPIYSNDNGSSWKVLPRYAGIIGVYRFEGGVETVDPFNSSIVIYAAGQMEVSHDGGLNYTLPEINQSGVDNPAVSQMDAFAFVPNSSTMFYAGNIGIFKSNDSGYMWNVLSNSPKNCSAIAGDVISNKYILYASNNSGLFYSDDFGLSWLKMSPYHLETISINPYNPTIMAATISTEAMISYDGGKNFFYANQSGIQTQYVYMYPGMLYQKLSNGTAILYFVSNRGVFASLNQGKTWYNIVYNIPTLVTTTMEIYNNICYVTTQGSGIWYSSSISNLSFSKDYPLLTGYLPKNHNLTLNGIPLNLHGYFAVFLKSGVNSIYIDNHLLYLNLTLGNIYFLNFSSINIHLNLDERNLPSGMSWTVEAGGIVYNLTGNSTLDVPLGTTNISIFPVRTDFSIYYPYVNNISINSSSMYSSYIVPFFEKQLETDINISDRMSGNLWTAQIAYNSGYALYGGGGDLMLTNVKTLNVKDVGNPFPDGQVFAISPFEDSFIIGGTVSNNRPGLALYNISSDTFQNLSYYLPESWNGPSAEISSIFVINQYSFGFIGGTYSKMFFGIIDNNTFYNFSQYLQSHLVMSNNYCGAYIASSDSILISNGANIGIFDLKNNNYSDISYMLPHNLDIGFSNFTVSKAFIASDGSSAIIIGYNTETYQPYVLLYNGSGFSDISNLFPSNELYDSVTWNGRDFVVSGVSENSSPYVILYNASSDLISEIPTTAFGNIGLIDSAVLVNSSLLFTTFNSRMVGNYSVLSSYYGMINLIPTGEAIIKTNVPANLSINRINYYGNYFPVPQFPGNFNISLSSAGYVTLNTTITVKPFISTLYSFFLEKLYNVTFLESGLPNGIAWYVNLSNGQSFSSTSNKIAFNETNDTYSYTIATMSKKYSPSPKSGIFTVNGSSINLTVTFKLLTYNITFTESGLPSGTSWSVTLNGTTLSSKTNTIAFSLPNGTYSYTIGNISGYNISKSSGSLTISGKNVTQSVTFSSVPSTTPPPKKPLASTSNTDLYIIIGAVAAVAVAGAVVAMMMRKRK